MPLARSAPSMCVGEALWMRLSTRLVALGWTNCTASWRPMLKLE